MLSERETWEVRQQIVVSWWLAIMLRLQLDGQLIGLPCYQEAKCFFFFEAHLIKHQVNVHSAKNADISKSIWWMYDSEQTLHFITTNSSGDEIANVNFLWRGLGATYDVYLGLIRNRVMDFILVLIKLIKLFFAKCYGWGATSENRSKIGDFAAKRSLIQNFRYKGSPPPIIFARLVRPMSALQLCRWQFLHKETL